MYEIYITLAVTTIFAALAWLIKGRIERMEKDIKDLKEDVVWKDTYHQFCDNLNSRLKRIEDQLDNLPERVMRLIK